MRNSIASTEDHCGSCVDIPISRGGTDQQYFPPEKTSLQKQPLLLEEIAHDVSTSNAIAAENPLFKTPPAVNPTLSSLLTLVLLI